MRRLGYFLKETILNLRANKPTAFISTVTIAFTMVLFGLFLLLYLNLSALVGSLRQEIKVILYLRDGISEKEFTALQERLHAQDGVSDITYISKQKALEDFRRSLEGQDILLRGLGDNPLPASFELTLEKSYQSSEAIGRVAQQLKGLKGVDDIQYGREWVENVNGVLEMVRLGGTLIGLILGLAAVVIISGTIRLTVLSRREDIEVLQLIGTTRFSIQIPFFLEGGFLGLAGGAVSILLLRVVYGLANSRLADIKGFLGGTTQLIFLPAPWLILFLAVGAGLGCIGSFLSIRRLL